MTWIVKDGNRYIAPTALAGMPPDVVDKQSLAARFADRNDAVRLVSRASSADRTCRVVRLRDDRVSAYPESLRNAFLQNAAYGKMVAPDGSIVNAGEAMRLWRLWRSSTYGKAPTSAETIGASAAVARRRVNRAFGTRFRKNERDADVGLFAYTGDGQLVRLMPSTMVTRGAVGFAPEWEKATAEIVATACDYLLKISRARALFYVAFDREDDMVSFVLETDKHDPKDGPVLVTISYFKPSGKWYTTDEDVLWGPDPNHYDGWKDFRQIVRLKDMFAVCMQTPLGFPQSCPPEKPALLDSDLDTSARAS